LRYSDKSIKEIAYEIGYEDIQPSAGFLKAAGISPSDFKKEIYLYFRANPIRSIFYTEPQYKRMPLYPG
jgi:AraC-like DNA-binding protein